MSIRNRIGVVLGVSAGALCATQMVVADHHVKSGKETSKTLQKSADFIEVNKHRAMVFSDHEFEKIIDVQSNCHIVSQWVSVDSWRFDERFVQEGTYIFVLVVHNAERSYSSRFDAK